MTSRDPRALTPLWISHHYPEQYDRCVNIGGRHVCRRCLVLYPLALVVMVFSLVGPWPGSIDGVLLVLLPLPAVAEFVLEHIGRLRYQPWRQVLCTVPLAIALGRGFALYVKDPKSLLFWGVVVVYGGLCVAVALLGPRRARTPAP
jgi:hypothetical protein